MMFRCAFLIVLGICIVCLCGCGGGGGSSNSNLRLIQIQSGGFSPKNVIVGVGSTVQWTNVDANPATNPHIIQSGTLDKTPNPVLRAPIVMLPGGDFSPNTFNANFGDTIQWVNQTGSGFSVQLQILDETGAVITTLSFTNPGDVRSYDGFQTAGRYTYRLTTFTSNAGTLTLFGIPNHPPGGFESPPLGTGGTFFRRFDTAGTVSYFDLNQSNPDQSFATGTITAQ